MSQVYPRPEDSPVSRDCFRRKGAANRCVQERALSWKASIHDPQSRDDLRTGGKTEGLWLSYIQRICLDAIPCCRQVTAGCATPLLTLIHEHGSCTEDCFVLEVEERSNTVLWRAMRQTKREYTSFQERLYSDCLVYASHFSNIVIAAV